VSLFSTELVSVYRVQAPAFVAIHCDLLSSRNIRTFSRMAFDMDRPFGVTYDHLGLKVVFI
jgi:hypothetical protein